MNNDVTKGYNIKNNIIVSPGKFEGEHVSIPYFWEIYLMGGADFVDENDIVISILEEDLDRFPDLNEYDYVLLNESEYGFVSGRFLTLNKKKKSSLHSSEENKKLESFVSKKLKISGCDICLNAYRCVFFNLRYLHELLKVKGYHQTIRLFCYYIRMCPCKSCLNIFSCHERVNFCQERRDFVAEYYRKLYLEGIITRV